MPKTPALPGSALPLDPDIQEAVADFEKPANKSRAIRTAVLAVLMEDLMDDVRETLKQHAGN